MILTNYFHLKEIFLTREGHETISHSVIQSGLETGATEHLSSSSKTLVAVFCMDSPKIIVGSLIRMGSYQTASTCVNS